MPETSSPARSVLIVEDDAALRRRLARAFRDRGYEAREASDYDSAIESARRDTPEFIVVDLRMPGRSGLEVIREIKALDPTTTAVVLTGYGSIATALEAVKLGATNYLTKPADVDQIIDAFHPGGGRPQTNQDTVDLPENVPTLARVEWEHINRVLSDCGGNVSQAARLLGIHRRSLQRKLAKYPTPR